MKRGPVRRLFRVFERPPSAERAVDIEIRHHLEQRAEELMAQEGLSRDAAIDEARRRFGDLDGIRRELEGGERKRRRDTRRLKVLAQTVEDVRFACRGLSKSPGLAGVVVLTLVLGIGLNTAIFSIVKGVLLDPLPYAQADRLVWGWGAFSGGSNAAISPPDYLDYREMSESFEYFGGRRGVDSYTLTGGDTPEIVQGESVTAEFFEALGATPVHGRGVIYEDETVEPRVVVLGHTFWQSHFGGREDALGETLQLDGRSLEVVGVMPPGFQLFAEPDFYVPIPLHIGGNLVRRFHNIRAVGRLKEGVTIEQAQAELDVIAARLEQQYPETNTTWRVPLMPLEQVFVGTTMRTTIWVLWGAVSLVLLIVCANVANLLLARGASRRTELAVRTALGAGRARIVRLLFAESIALAAVGCVGGLGLAVLAVRLVRNLGAGVVPRIEEVALDPWVVAFAVAGSVLTGVVFGLLPALRSSRLDLTSTLKTGGRGASGSSSRARSTLVVAEVALSVVLLVGASLLIQSFSRLLDVDPGFEPEGSVITTLSLSGPSYETEEARASFFARLSDRLASIPGVEEVGHGSYLPLTGGATDTYIGVPGRLELGTDQQFNAQFRTVGHTFFDVMRIPLVAGRGFGDADRLGSAPVVIINKPFADAIFPDENPVGQRIQIDLGETFDAEVIGVVGGVTHFALQVPAGFHVYLSYDQMPVMPFQQLVLRTSVDPASLTDAIAPAVADLDPRQPVGTIETYQEVVERGVATPRYRMVLLGTFAALALTLAIIGVYGVLSYMVVQRRRELGIRIALGASRIHVVRMVVRHGLALAAIGLSIGLVGAFGLTRFMSTLLYEVSATDTTTFVLVAVVLALTALLASYLPARRASSVDPTTTLRQE